MDFNLVGAEFTQSKLTIISANSSKCLLNVLKTYPKYIPKFYMNFVYQEGCHSDAVIFTMEKSQ